MINLSQLSQLSQRLNASTDELNDELEKIETQINALNLGVEAWLTDTPLEEHFSEDDLDAGGEPIRTRFTTELGYARLPNGWGLVVRQTDRTQYLNQFTGGDWGWSDARAATCGPAKPLLRASRTLRTEAVDSIPALIPKLHEAGMRMIDAVEKARDISRSLA